METGYAESNELKLYYEVHGAGEPLILISGLGADISGWMFQIPAFSQHFKVIVFDNRDAGRSSEAEGPYSIADMADDTAAILDSLAIAQAHVLGVSMGGAIAQELVIRYPEKVRKLILASTMGDFARFQIPIFEPLRFIKERDPDNKVFAIQQLIWCMTHDFLKNAEAVEQMLGLMQNPRYPQSLKAFAQQIDANKSFDALEQLRAVKSPVLVLVGDQDILTPPWAARALAQAIPDAQLQILEGGGHGSMWEIPDKLNSAVINFLS